jgi:hypothetical protein
MLFESLRSVLWIVWSVQKVGGQSDRHAIGMRYD